MSFCVCLVKQTAQLIKDFIFDNMDYLLLPSFG